MRKMPSAFVTAWNRKFVSGCTRLIRTLGITEPLGSVTLPVIVPVSTCAGAEPARPIQTTTTTPTLCNGIFHLSTPCRINYSPAIGGNGSHSIYTLPFAVLTGCRNTGCRNKNHRLYTFSDG